MRILGGDQSDGLRLTTFFDLYGLPGDFPGFRKTLHGPLATADTGLAALRERCPRFDVWVSTLELL